MFFGDVTIEQYLLVAVIAFAAAILGGVTGYGTGVVLPPVLLPIVGPEAVIPIVSVAALLTNFSRAVVFRSDFDVAKAKLIVAVALPACAVGAFAYTLLTGPAVGLLLGAVLISMVPARRLMQRRLGHLETRGIAVASVGYGFLVGGTSGVGVLLLSLLLAAGLHGVAVVATDAGISVVLAVVKIAVFQGAGALPLSSWIMAAVIGAAAVPGAMLAKRIAGRLSLRSHALMLDGIVILGGVLLIAQSLRSFP